MTINFFKMRILDSIYIVYHRWYDIDTFGIKKSKAPVYSSNLLGITISLWLLFAWFSIEKIFVIKSSQTTKYFVILVGLIVMGVCQNIYANNKRGVTIYNNYINSGNKIFSRKRSLIWMILLNILPIAIIILIALI